MTKTKKLLLSLLLAAFASPVCASSFVVNKIRFEGLKYISQNTAKNYLPIKEGRIFNTEQTSDVIRDLYKTGFFSNIDLARSGNDIIIRITERQIIGALNLTGIKNIPQKQLQSVLKNLRIAEGQVLDYSAINSLQQALVEQYNNAGNYSARVQIDIKEISGNRVAVNVNVYEGPPTVIKETKIIGNDSFDQSTLLKEFDTVPAPWWKVWKFFTHDDQFSREKLSKDLEKLSSFYMDRGYLRFKIDSAQVSISPDKKYIYIIIHVTEGPIYHIKGYGVSGNLIGKEKEINQFISRNLQSGSVFSRGIALAIADGIKMFVGSFGYANAEIQTQPEIDDANKQIFIKYVVNPGKRVYVRRISFTGNNKTNEAVLRRELRQQEGALYSTPKIEESKRRLRNLGYVQDIDVKMEPSPEDPDKTDLIWNIKEAQSLSASVKGGYSDMDGFIYGASINEQNFLGTGVGVGLQFDNSSYSHTYSFSYFDPYLTANGISMHVNVYMQRVTPDDFDLSSYTTNSYGGTAIFGIPIAEYNTLNLGFGFDHIKIHTDLGTAPDILNFLKQHPDPYNEIKLLGGWGYNKLDRAIFPTEGFAHGVSLEAGFPASSGSVSYYTLDYNFNWYHPLFNSNKFIFRTYAHLGYGNGFANTEELPFFRNFFAGGIGSVRGYSSYSLGPRDVYRTEDGHVRSVAKGGNVLTVGSASLIFPNPLGNTLRTSVFVDLGNVYDQEFNFRGLRNSAGLQIEWRSPLGLLSCSFARPIKSHEGDSTKIFDFAFGTSI